MVPDQQTIRWLLGSDIFSRLAALVTKLSWKQNTELLCKNRWAVFFVENKMWVIRHPRRHRLGRSSKKTIVPTRLKGKWKRKWRQTVFSCLLPGNQCVIFSSEQPAPTQPLVWHLEINRLTGRKLMDSHTLYTGTFICFRIGNFIQK